MSSVCIECGEVVKSLYTEYGRGNIKLLHCDACGKFADRYLEYDYVIIFIDMLLHKRPVYRHLLFNRLQYSQSGWNSGIAKLGILLVLFEVYMKWFRLDRLDLAVAPEDVSLHSQYLYILAVCTLDVARYICAFAWMANLSTSLNRLSMALVLSSFGKVLLIVMVVWNYGATDPSILVNILVITSNIEAISVFMKTTIPATIGILGAGLASKLAIQYTARTLDPTIELTFI
eukprot:jgi/Hompol1/4157/HPOL_003502-RA